MKPIAETVTEAFLQWMAPMIFAGFFLLFIAGVLAFFSAVMAFVFGITFVVKEGRALDWIDSPNNCSPDDGLSLFIDLRCLQSLLFMAIQIQSALIKPLYSVIS
jgi:hypothetical protein